MKLEIEVGVTLQDHSTAIERKLDTIIQQQEKIMSVLDDLNAELVSINVTTDEIAADIADLVKNAGPGAISAADADAFKTSLLAVSSRLKGVAATHTPGSVVPPEEPPIVG